MISKAILLLLGLATINTVTAVSMDMTDVDSQAHYVVQGDYGIYQDNRSFCVNKVDGDSGLTEEDKTFFEELKQSMLDYMDGKISVEEMYDALEETEDLTEEEVEEVVEEAEEDAESLDYNDADDLYEYIWDQMIEFFLMDAVSRVEDNVALFTALGTEEATIEYALSLISSADSITAVEVNTVVAYISSAMDAESTSFEGLIDDIKESFYGILDAFEAMDEELTDSVTDSDALIILADLQTKIDDAEVNLEAVFEYIESSMATEEAALTTSLAELSALTSELDDADTVDVTTVSEIIVDIETAIYAENDATTTYTNLLAALETTMVIAVLTDEEYVEFNNYAFGITE